MNPSATGTYDLDMVDPEKAQRQAHRATHETQRSVATGCDKQAMPFAQKKAPKPLQFADLGDGVRDDATTCTSSPGGTRTPDQGIMSPLL